MSHTILGTDLLTDEQVAIDTEYRQRSMYVVGIQGGGKSSFLQTLIHQDIVSGSSVIVIDPHEDLLYDVIAQLPEEYLHKTYFLDLSDRAFPFGLNIFSCANHKDDEQRDITRNRVAHMFERIWPETVGGRYFGTLLENVIDTLIENPGTTMADIPRLLQDELFRGRCIKSLRNQEVKAYWKDEYNKKSASVQQKERDPLVSRVRELLRQTTIKNIVCQKHTTFDFRTAIENREIILINLPLRNPAYEKSAPIVGIMLMSEICRAVFSFSDIREMHKRPRFSLFVDEYQNFTTSDFSRLFTEGRKFGIRTTVAHQERSQLDELNKNASQTAFSKVAFQTTNKDAAELADYFRTKDKRVRPENVYPDVLIHLKDHPNAEVAAFYTNYIKPMQKVAKEKIKHYRDEEVRPELVVEDNTFKIDPEWAIKQLESLQKCLYEVSCDKDYVTPWYAQLALWWDFRASYCKRYWSQPDVEPITPGWKLDCHEVAFDRDDNYFVSLLRHYGGIATWTPFPKTAATRYALADETLGKKWFEKTDLAVLLEGILANKEQLASVIINRQLQGGIPQMLEEAYTKGTLTSALLASWRPPSGTAHPWNKLEALAVRLKARSTRYTDTSAYLQYLQSAYKDIVTRALPKPVFPTTSPLERRPLFVDVYLWQEYERHMQGVLSIPADADDQPPMITAPLPLWKLVMENVEKRLTLAEFLACGETEQTYWKYEVEKGMLRLLTRHTPSAYFLQGKTNPEEVAKELKSFCSQWQAYTSDVISWTKNDVSRTLKRVSADLNQLAAALAAKREEIQQRLNRRMTWEMQRHEKFLTLLLATVEEVRARPLGELKTPSSTEMSNAILALKPRQACVRIGTEVYHIRTLDVPKKVDKGALTRRIASIREQTHQTYCQKLSVIEAAGVAENTEEDGTQPRLKEEQETAPTTRVFQAFEELDEE